jgi:hypothetical protein
MLNRRSAAFFSALGISVVCGCARPQASHDPGAMSSPVGRPAALTGESANPGDAQRGSLAKNTDISSQDLSRWNTNALADSPW